MNELGYSLKNPRVAQRDRESKENDTNTGIEAALHSLIRKVSQALQNDAEARKAGKERRKRKDTVPQQDLLVEERSHHPAYHAESGSDGLEAKGSGKGVRYLKESEN